MTKKELIKRVISEDAKKHIKNFMEEKGMEYTEQRIKELYKNNKTLRDYMLDKYSKIIKDRKSVV